MEQYSPMGRRDVGNHLACKATLSVLEVLEKENLMQHAKEMCDFFKIKAHQFPKIKAIKGRGLMLGLEFDSAIAELRKTLIYKHRIFTGSSKNPNLLRILPPLTIQKHHLDVFFEALKIELA